MEISCRCHSTTGGITSLTLLPFGLWAPVAIHLKVLASKCLHFEIELTSSPTIFFPTTFSIFSHFIPMAGQSYMNIHADFLIYVLAYVQKWKV